MINRAIWKDLSYIKIGILPQSRSFFVLAKVSSEALKFRGQLYSNWLLLLSLFLLFTLTEPIKQRCMNRWIIFHRITWAFQNYNSWSSYFACNKFAIVSFMKNLLSNGAMITMLLLLWEANKKWRNWFSLFCQRSCGQSQIYHPIIIAEIADCFHLCLFTTLDAWSKCKTIFFFEI